MDLHYKFTKENGFYKIIKFNPNSRVKKEEVLEGEFESIEEAKKSVISLFKIGKISWQEREKGTTGVEMIKCLYCNNWKEKPDGEGEHVIPESLGSPIHTIKICAECNKESNEKIDDPFNNLNFTKFLLTYLNINKQFVIAKSHKEDINGITYPFKIVLSGNSVKVIPLNSTLTYPNNLSIGLRRYLNYSCDTNLAMRLSAKIILGLTSLYFDGFRDTNIANQLYDLSLNGISQPNLKAFYNQQENIKLTLNVNKLEIVLPTGMKWISLDQMDVNKGKWAHHYAFFNNKEEGYILIVVALFSGLFEMVIKITNDDTDEYKLLHDKNNMMVYIDPRNGRTEKIDITLDPLTLKVKSNK